MSDLSSMLEQLSELREARASGARRISTMTNGVRKEVEYRSDAELLAAIRDLERRIAAMGAKPITTVRIASSKGL